MRSGDRAIRLLIRLYPAGFRERYGESIVAFHRARIGEARAAGEPAFKVWFRIVCDHVASAVAERIVARRAHRSAGHAPFTLPDRGDSSMTILAGDVRIALRGLARRPGFAAVVLTTIALGIGANAAIFSVVNAILLRPLPYAHPERVVSFSHEPPQWLTSVPAYFDYKRDATSFEVLSAYTRSEGTIDADGEPERVPLARVTLDFFAALGVTPAAGRFFAGDEDRGNPTTAIIISHGLWQRRYAGDSAAIGRKLLLNGIPRTIVGVMPARFEFPTKQTAIWLPMPRYNLDSLGSRANNSLFVVGRLRPRITVDAALVEATQLARRMMREYPGEFDPQRPLVPHIELVGDQLLKTTRPYLFAMFGAVGFVLLIACANVANLLLARGEGRRKELAVRTALGASGRRLATQLLVECTVLSVGGGLLGLLLAVVGDRALVALAPADVPRLDQVGVDWGVVAFTFVVSIATGLVFGLVPALRAARSAPVDALKEGGKTSGGANAAGSRRARGALVTAEVTLAVILLSGGGMLLRSLWNLQSADLGFDERGVLTANVSLLQSAYNDQRSTVFFSQLIERVRMQPGVRAVGAAGWLPVVDAGGLWGVMAEGESYTKKSQPNIVPQQVTPGYFKAMGMRLVAGRDFTWEDREGGPYVGVVSEAMAKELWPGQSPLGSRFKLGGGSTWVEVVGVVGDIRSRGFHDTPEPTMYFPYAQTGKSAYFIPRSMNIVVRTDGDPASLITGVRRAVRELDAAVPVAKVRTLEAVVGVSVASRRFSSAMIAGFAVLALVLAGIGIFGVVSYGVSERRFEIGVRMALGAERGNVLALVVSEGMRQAGVGIVIGLIGSVVVARMIRSLLVGVAMVDAPILVAAAAALLIVAAAAALLPARRAIAVQPTEALRGR
jgi:putative ABC transport system permease protein